MRIIFLVFVLLFGCENDFAQNALDGEIVVIEETSAITTCGVFGYPDLCKMTGTMGRIIAGEDYIQSYAEVPSEFYPNPLTSTTYFSKAYYPNYADTNFDYADLRDALDGWPEAAEWGDLREDWCSANPETCYED